MTPIYSFINLLDASSTLPNISEYSVPIFAACIGLAAVLAGLMLGGAATKKFIGSVKGAIMNAVGLSGKRRGGRRRRR